MSVDWGYTVTPDEGGGDVMHALAEADEPRHGDRTPREWVKANLFNTWYNSIITVVFGALAVYLTYRALSFVFVTARWEPVRANLELFMIGTFPREERTRIVVQLLLMSGGIGLFVGWLRMRSVRQAEHAGIERPPTSWREYASIYWALTLFVVTCLVIGARTIDPWLLAIGCVVTGIATFAATTPLRNPLTKVVLLVPLAVNGVLLMRIEDLNNQAAYAIAIAATLLLVAVNLLQWPSLTLSMALLGGVAAFQALSGTGGIAWLFIAAALTPFVLDVVGRISDSMTSKVPAYVAVAAAAVVAVWQLVTGGLSLVSVVAVGLTAVAAFDAIRRRGDTAVRIGGIVTLGALSWVAATLIDLGGIDWKDWSGLHLNLVVAGAAIVLAFPIGLLLALGRRSSLPVLRWLCTAYIELIRGVPLITLLLMGQFFIGFFLDTDTPLSNVTRATAAVTMFSAAYIAEIVRGGLQSVDKGQTEAGQALGLPPAKITRLLVLPQALRAVIPAMVGQFISLFKDTSLLTIIGIIEFLGVRQIVHSQEAFRGFGIAETLVFVAFGFWAFSFTMSRESQRLERRLGVGVR
jgi:general L-amino acid transport system permease protein